MGVEGIGASVVRKEDRRFITGKGKYVDDIKLVGMTYAHFVRSPHAHAKVKSIDPSAALKMPGVIAVLNGQAACRRQGRQPDLRLGHHLQGRLADEDGRMARDGAGDGALRRPGGRGRDRRDQEPGARRGRSGRRQLRGTAGRRPTSRPRSRPGAPQLHPEAPGNIVYDWDIGDEAATKDAFAKAANVVTLELTNNRLVPNAMEPRAAIADYDTAEEHFTLYTTSQNPHVARLVLSAFYNIAPEHKLRVIAPDVGGGFGSKIYIYPEEMVCLWASKKVGRPVKWTGDRTEAFLTDAHGRDHVIEGRDGVRQGQQDPRAAGEDACQFRRLHVAVLVGGADLSLRDAAVGPVRHPGDLRRGDRRSTPTPRRSMPIAAQADPRRATCSSA